MAKKYNGGIKLSTGFKLEDPQPIADYMVVELISDLDNLPNQFNGMNSFVEEDENYWIKKSTGWHIINENDSDTVARTIDVTLSDLGVTTEDEVTPLVVASYYNSLGLTKSAKEFFIIQLVEAPLPTLDIEGDFASAGIVDYESWLEFTSSSDDTGIPMTDFRLLGNRITGNLLLDQTILPFYSGIQAARLGLTKINRLVSDTVTQLGVEYCDITTTLGTENLPALEYIAINQSLVNKIEGIIITENLRSIQLIGNQLTAESFANAMEWVDSIDSINPETRELSIVLEDNPGVTSPEYNIFKSALEAKGYNVYP